MNQKIKLIILTSLILNIILIGLVAGHSYKRFNKNPKHKIASFIDKTTLPNDERILLKQEFDKTFMRKHKDKSMMRAIHEELYEIMISDSFEGEKYRDTIYKISNHHHQKQNSNFEIVIKIAENLDLEERKKLAKILRRPPPKRHRR